MFGMDHLSAAAEAAERRQQEEAAAAAAPIVAEAEAEAEEPLEELKAQLATLHVADPSGTLRTEGSLSRSEVLEFFTRNAEMLVSEPVRTRLRKLCRTNQGRSELNTVLVDLQRSVFDAMGIERNFGVSKLNSLYFDFPGDDELFDEMTNFARNCSAAYVRAVQDAAPKKLQTTGVLTKQQIINFVDACNSLMMQRETRETFRSHFLEHKALPNQLCIDMQRDMLETLGVQMDFGVSRLNRISQDFPNDQEIGMKMMTFQRSAQEAVMRSQHSDEELRVMEREGREQQIRMQKQKIAGQEQMRQVELAVGSMSDAEKETLKTRMLSKWLTLFKLPMNDRIQYMARLSPTDQADYAKVNMIVAQEAMAQGINPDVYCQRLIAQGAHRPPVGAAAEDAGPAAPSTTAGASATPEPAGEPAAPPSKDE